jgi:hypothetical protein
MSVNTSQIKTRHSKPAEFKIIDDRIVRFHDVVVHRFTVGDVEDPEVYAAMPIMKWQESEQGQWVMQNAVEPPYYMREVDYVSYGYRFAIVARLSEVNETYFKLKYT